MMGCHERDTAGTGHSKGLTPTPQLQINAPCSIVPENKLQDDPDKTRKDLMNPTHGVVGHIWKGGAPR